MGNCWPKPVEITPRRRYTRPSNPGHKNEAYKTIKSRNHNNWSPTPAAANEGGGGGGGVAVPASGQIITPNLKMFTLAELTRATSNFGPGTVLGEGGFGRVFQGWVDEKTYAPSRVGVGIPVAVKKSNPDSEQGLKEWQAEVKFLGKFSHPNLVKLLGYCWEEN